MKTNSLTVSKIYIDRLKNDDIEQILEVVDPNFLDVNDVDVTFVHKVMISGQAYLANHHLILDLKIKATASMPCCICNEKTDIPIEIDDFTHTVELSEMNSSIYDYASEVREAILLKLPQFLECHHGHCPEREGLNQFLKRPTSDTYSPFSELSSLNKFPN